MSFVKKFLDWDRPLLLSATERLLAEKQSESIDFSNTMLVVPTSRSAHKLKYELAKTTARKNKGLIPPKIVTPDYFLFNSEEDDNVASYTETLLSWINILENTKQEDLVDLFPAPPPKDNRLSWSINIANTIINLTNSITEAGYTVKDIVENQYEIIADDIKRWHNLLKLESDYLNLLKNKGLTDSNKHKLEATLNPSIPDNIERLIIIGIVDPVPVVTRAWEKLTEKIAVETWIHSTESLETSFDKWGKPVSAHWHNVKIDIPDWENNVYIAETPDSIKLNLTEIMSKFQAENTPVNLDQTSIFAINKNLIYPIRDFFSEYSIEVSDPAGSDFSTSKLYALLDHLYRFLLNKDYTGFSDLVRHPDILNFLNGQIEDFNVALVLSVIDEMQNKYLPESINDMKSMLDAEEKNQSKYKLETNLLKLAFYKILELTNSSEPGSLDLFLNKFLKEVYGQKTFDNNIIDTDFVSTLKTFQKKISEFKNSKIDINHYSREKQLNIFLNILSKEIFQPECLSGKTLEIYSWSETQWSNAQNIILAGMNEKYIPGGIQADIFLPDSLKQKLGIRNTATRFSRDSYLLTSLLKAHKAGEIQIIINKTDITGDPLKPSRLLFLADHKSLMSRLRKIFVEPQDEINPNTINDYTPSFLLKPSREKIEPILYATDFKNYLSSPFTFYLKKALKMEKIDDRQDDIAPGYFGDICHSALQRLAVNKHLEKVKSPEELQTILTNYAEKEILDRYGKNQSLPAMISVTGMKQRLSKAAEYIWQDYSMGWRILKVEAPFSLIIDNNFLSKHSAESHCLRHPYVIRGKIDRIDKNINTGEIRIIDYKTGEHAKEPANAHYKTPRNIERYPDYASFVHNNKTCCWLDLQLPIYYLMLENSDINPDKDVYCSYFNLPKVLSDTGIYPWYDIKDFIHYAASCIIKIVINIENRVFWPPYEISFFDDIYNEFLFKSPDTTVDTDYMKSL